MRPQRIPNPRPRRRSLLIQCEGQKTEPNYLDDLCKACGVRHRMEVQVKRGKGQNAVVTMEAAIVEGSRRLLGERIYDAVYCVLDVEHIAHEAKLDEALGLAKKHNIRVFLSHPSFEVWLISHFERTAHYFDNGDSAEAYLNTHWKKQFQSDYDKGDLYLYKKLADRVNEAIENARWVLETFHENAPCRNSNSSTEVYQLVLELLSS